MIGIRRRLPLAVPLGPVLALALALAPAAAAPAQAGSSATRVLQPSRVSPSTLTFDVRWQLSRVSAATLVVGKRRLPIAAERVRAAAGGRLRVGLPRGTSRRAMRRSRLHLQLRRATAARAPACSQTFGVGAWPSACWRPYSAASPFNRPVGERPRVHADSAAVVSRVLSFGKAMNLEAGHADTAGDWYHPTYYSRPSDPLYTLHCTQRWGRCAIEGIEVRIPAQARAAGGGDGHMTIVDQSSGWEYDLWRVQTKPSGGGRLAFAWGGRTRIDGDGLGSDATAARFGNLAGAIRAQELTAGRIDHALFMVVRCDSGGHVYPAMKSGRACADRAGAPPMGARFQLDMSTLQINALPVPVWKKTILHAMADYGMYVGDTGGSGWGLQFESGSTYTSFGIEDPLVAFGRAHGVPNYHGRQVFNIHDGVDWAALRMLDPCTARAAC